MKSPTTLLLILFALFAAAASTVAWKEHLELIELRAGYLTTEQRAALQKAAWDAQKRVARLEAELATLRNGSATAQGTRTGPGGPGGRNQPGNFGEAVAVMMRGIDNPEMQKLLALQARFQVNQRYGALFRELHLSPAQIDQLRNLLVDREMAGADVMMTAAQQGLNPMQDQDEIRQMIQSAQADEDAKIKSELGDSDYADYQSYQHSLGQRAVVNQLQQALSYGDTPLTPSQSSQLVQILQQNPVPSGGGQNVFAGGGGGPGSGGGAQISDAAIANAQGILSPPQIQAMQEIQQQQQLARQLGQAMLRSANGGGQGGPEGGGGGGSAGIASPGPGG